MVNIPAVEIVGVGKRFGLVTALERIDFGIADGEFVSLLGPSGCGKSTLLRIIAGFERPTEGRIRIYGDDITDWLPERRPTNLVFQRGALFPHMTVRENIGYGLRLRHWSRERREAKIAEMLALVRLDELGDRAPGQLSGGQAQRVALARALAAEPRVLLLDEPLSALDLKLRQQMQLELRAIQKRLGATFVFVTHDQTEALVMSDRVAIMNGGRIVQYDTPREIYRRPNSVFVSNFVGATNLFRGTVATLGPGRVVLSTELGCLAVAHAGAGLHPGEPAALSVRPEVVRLRRPGATGNEPGIAGSVSEVIYQGSTVRIGVRIAAGIVIWAEGRDEEVEGLSPGDDVALSWSESAATLLREDAE